MAPLLAWLFVPACRPIQALDHALGNGISDLSEHDRYGAALTQRRVDGRRGHGEDDVGLQADYLPGLQGPMDGLPCPPSECRTEENMSNPLNVVIDISHHDGNVNLAKAKEDGIMGVIQKATQGQTFKDPTYQRNQQKAKGAAPKLARFTPAVRLPCRSGFVLVCRTSFCLPE